MAHADVVGCDMCEAVAPREEFERFYRVYGYVERFSKDGRNRERTSIGRPTGEAVTLCEKCVEPLLKFQASMQKADKADARLTKRVLVALGRDR